MTKQFILFDFDGVIVDSFASAFAVNKIICPSITETAYRKKFEGNINDWTGNDLDQDKRCRNDIVFFSEYVPRIKSVVLIEGMVDVIKKLAQFYKMIIVSSPTPAPIRELLE